MNEIDQVYVPVSYLADALNLSPTSVRLYMADHNKPTHQVGGRRCYFRADADEVITAVRAAYLAKAAGVGATVGSV